MMDIQSPTCFRPATALPRNSSSGTLSLNSQIGDISETNKYAFHRSNSYTGSMVVESQTHNFRTMTPDPHPDNVPETDSEKLDMQASGHKSVLMPPEGAMTPSEEPVSIKRELSDEFSSKRLRDYEQCQNDELLPKHNEQHFSEQMANNSFNESIDSIDMAQFCVKKRRLSESVTLKNAEAVLEEAAFKLGIDKSPPTLSPRTLSDTDFEGTSTGSPSVSISGERRRRKPNIEDIVRRMKEVETDYYSEDSENEDVFDEQGTDEVDGDLTVRMPVLSNQMDALQNRGKMYELGEIQKNLSPSKAFDGEINENNNIIEKVRGDELDKENKDIEMDKNGIPLPASSKVEPGIMNGESVIKQVGHMTPTHSTSSNWLPGHFNGFPMGFPFQASPPELPFSKFISPFENKFNSPECEKDYLKCQYCERTFRRQKNLENHIENTHHGKSPVRKKSGETGDMYFKCNHCPYTTKHQSNLYVHLRIHTGERPYICGACGVQYSQSHSLKSHIINKHDGIMSYYIKEKRTRSPRGLGYLATQPIPGESPVFKMPASPMLSQFPGTPNGLHLPPVSLQQNMPLKHSPQHKLGLPGNHPGSVPSSPLVSPNGLHSQQQQQISPGNQQHMQMSPQQPLPRPPFPPFPHMLPDRMEMAQKSLELAKFGLMNFPFYGGGHYPMKPSPPFHHMNGHSPMSPQLHNGMNQPLPQQQPPAELPMSQHGGSNAQQYHKPHNPLQEIHDNRHSDEDGAIDLRKKSKEEALDLALSDKTAKCSEDGSKCQNCLHLLKLKMLRMNVVRMLSILVPNLNFEEKGINAEGDSVDDLLRDVIESNIHDEDLNE